MGNPVFRKSDEELMGSLQQGDLPGRKAETQFFSQYSYFIREGVKKYRLTEDDAFDAYSDSVLAVMDSIRKGRFQRRSSLKTYTFQIFQNKCVDFVRKNTTTKNNVNRTVLISDFLLAMSDATQSVLQKLSEKTDFDVLGKKIATLGDKCRELLRYFANGYSDKEMAEGLGYKTGDVVKTSRLRCLEKLRQTYKNELIA